MSLPEDQIETLLRRAPRPAPASDLKSKLVADAASALKKPATASAPNKQPRQGWLQRWWPVLIPAAASCLCAVALTVQHLETQDLKTSLDRLNKNLPATSTPAPPSTQPANDSPTAADQSSASEQSEMDRLNKQIAQLRADVVGLERMQRRNQELKTQLNAPPTLAPEEMEAIKQAKEKAQSIACINNMKQLGLAVRIWENDHDGVFPPDMLSMSNELSTPKILVCPSDSNRVAAKDWAAYNGANCSYDYLTPLAVEADAEPNRVLARCPIHGHIGLCDGSVQGEVAKKHPELLQQENGKLYLRR